jgi:hypothetical protein
MALERQKYQLEHALNLNVGIKTEKIQKTREFVKEAIESTRGGRSVMRKGVQTTLFTELIENKEIQITPTTPNINVEPISRQRLIYQQIVDGRFAAKELVESPVFAEYAKDLYQGDAEEHQEAVEFIAENHQELYCLSLSEQTEVFYNTLEKAGIKPDASKVVEGILDIGRYAAGVESIREELEKLTAIIEATNGNFHERMQIIEDTINTRTFTNNDVNVLKLTLEKVLAKPSEFLSPEFIIELRKAHNRITTMLENGNYDDRLVAATVHMLSNFYPETMQIGEASYEEFFQSKLNKYGVSSPDEIPDDKKDDFFNEVDAEWKSEDEGGNGEGGKDGVAVDDQEDEMADVNMYGESESCKNCGSPKCLCHGLTEEEEDEEEESGKGKQGDENLEDEEEGTKSKSKTNDPDDAMVLAPSSKPYNLTQEITV